MANKGSLYSADPPRPGGEKHCSTNVVFTLANIEGFPRDLWNNLSVFASCSGTCEKDNGQRERQRENLLLADGFFFEELFFEPEVVEHTF